MDKRVSVIGLRRSGSAAVSLLKRRGAFVFGSDTDRNLDVSSLDIPFELGKNSEKVLESDLIVVSPGVPLNNPVLLAARKRGIKIIGELELAASYIQAKIIAVTGTNGKTTTCLLIDSIMKAASVDSIVAGNIYPGTPLSLVVDRLSPNSVVIAEVSSFQLETIEEFKPYIAVLLNLTPDHLDRYQTMDEYIQAKKRIFKNQSNEDFSLLNIGDSTIRSISLTQKTKRVNFSVSKGLGIDAYINEGFIWYKDVMIFKIPQLFVPEEDILAASCVAKVYGIKNEVIRRGLLNFKGAPHRMEHIGDFQNRIFINNSMCTNPSSFVTSLGVLKKNPVIILGGKSKKIDIESMIDAITERVKFCIVLGESGDSIIRGLKRKNYHNFQSAKGMRDAVRRAYSVSSPGDILMLSPGFASFDMFRDFEDRGNAFKREVDDLIDGC